MNNRHKEKLQKPKGRKGHFSKPGTVPTTITRTRLDKIEAGKGKKLSGSPSLVEKLMRANLLPLVCVETRKFRMSNPQTGYADLYRYLADKFPDYFDASKKLYAGSNFSKQLNQSREWQAAYWSAAYNIDEMLETKIHEGLYNDKFDNKDIVKLYDIQRRAVENKEILDSIEKNVTVSMNISEGDGEC